MGQSNGIGILLTVFENAVAFNADVSKWNTAKVTTMIYSTSTPPLSLLFLVSIKSDPVLSHSIALLVLFHFLWFNHGLLTSFYSVC
jgi:surface protein